MLVISALRSLVAQNDLVLAHRAGTAFFEKCLAEIDEPPELVMHVMTTEASTLLEPDVAEWVELALRSFPSSRHGVIGLGCLGFFAAVLHMQAVKASSALILVIDAPKGRTQSMLDSIGSGEGGDKMLSCESLAFVHLKRKQPDNLLPNDIVIDGCEVLAQSAGIAGGIQFMQRIGAVCRSSVAGVNDLVSFEVGSAWADQLLNWFEKEVVPTVPRLRLLPSSELGCIHHLSVKPLLEIERYSAVLHDRGGLAVATIGAGGRLGFLRLSSTTKRSSCTDWSVVSNAIVRSPIAYSNDVFNMHAEDRLLFVASEYRGFDNTYFYWPINVS